MKAGEESLTLGEKKGLCAKEDGYQPSLVYV
jgi:hypothetical protein